MDVREKLVELVKSAIIDWEHGDVSEWIADNLISNGVTVQGWIPVTERLPDENNGWVLCLCASGAMEVLKFDYTMRDWDSQYPRRCYMENYVTHWMPLPQPPKGE